MKRLILAAACSFAFPAMAQTIATVNGQEISKKELDKTVEAMANRGGAGLDADQLRSALTKELIDRELIVQEAEKEGIDKKEDVQFLIESSKKEILIGQFMSDWLKDNEVSDKELKEGYDELIKSADKNKEYKVSHILVEDEDEAKKLLKQIKDKKVKFADAAKEHSKDSGSAKEGGDLGWADADNYVPEFAEAVKKAKKGELISEPVESQFGFHIIQLEDERKAKAPDFDEVKPQLQQMLSQEKIQKYLDELRAKADVKINEEEKDDSKKDKK